MKKNKTINWFWAHRRNTSLHHMSFIMHGLKNKGWQPVVDFYFDNQIIIGTSNGGTYIFYDRDQLSNKGVYKNIWKSIDGNPNFNQDFDRRSNEIFGSVTFKCLEIEESNLSLLSNEELLRLYDGFMITIMSCPIITVQLWGIEACLDDDYNIMRFLKNKLRKIGEIEKLQFYKEMLSVNSGETVAFTEQENFYQVANIIYKNISLKNIFIKEKPKIIENKIKKYPYEKQLIENHIKKYKWVNSEYVSNIWDTSKWLSLFKEAIVNKITPIEKLEEVLGNFNNLNKEKKEIIKKLNPPKNVLHSIEALSEFIEKRDWAKGYMTRFLLSHRLLLEEIGKRMKYKFEDMLYLSYIEIDDYLRSGKKVTMKEIKKRKSGYAIIIKNGKFKIFSGDKNVKKIIKSERISDPFEEMKDIREFRGLVASMGKIVAKVRVIEDASRINELKSGEIIATYMTTMEFTPAFRRAAAVITDEGGMSCHAAIISREFKLPCIVGTKIATRVLQTGDEIEVDANRGIVRILKRKK